MAERYQIREEMAGPKSRSFRLLHFRDFDVALKMVLTMGATFKYLLQTYWRSLAKLGVFERVLEFNTDRSSASRS